MILCMYQLYYIFYQELILTIRTVSLLLDILTKLIFIGFEIFTL